MRTASLRMGEESAEFRVSLQVVDDLLWSLDEGKERQSRSQLAQKIPPLIRLLAQGLRAIGARDEEFKPFFDELFLIHLRKMQRRRRSGQGRRRFNMPALERPIGQAFLALCQGWWVPIGDCDQGAGDFEI